MYLKRKKSANAFRAGAVMFDNLFLRNYRYPFAISDKNGEYKIDNIPDGEYELTIMSTWQNIYGKTIRAKDNELTYPCNENIKMDIEMFDSVKVTSVEYISNNKIKITWDNPIDDEFEYRIIPVYSYKNKDGRIMTRRDYNYWNAHDVRIEKEAIIDIDFIKRNALGNINQFSSEEHFFPNQFFETFYLGGEYEFKIAYHSKGDDYYYFNFESGGLFPNIKEEKIYVEGNELIKGDKLILERNYVEAIEWFEKYIKKETDDVHALNILSAIYTDGYRLRDEEGYNERKDAYRRDIERAKEVTEQLYLIVGNNRVVLLRLQRIYEDLEMYDELNKIKSLLE